MSHIEHDLGPEVTGRARPVTAQRTPAVSQPPLLDLQRLAGNAAVNSAIKSGRFDSMLPVQRLEEETEEDETETSELPEQPAVTEEEQVEEEETE